MDPTSIKVIIHGRPKYCGLWSPNALYGWYIVPSLEHYRCHQIGITATYSVRIGKTVSWFTHKLTMTTSTATNRIIATVKDLTLALKQINKILYFHHLIPSHAKHFLTRFHILQCLIWTKITTIPHFSTSKGVHSKTCCCTSKGISIHYTRFSKYPPYNTKILQRSSSHQIQNFSKNITFSFSVTQIQVQPSP